MYDVLLVEEEETLQYGVGEPLYEAEGEALVVVDLDQLIQVHTAHNKHQSNTFSKVLVHE